MQDCLFQLSLTFLLVTIGPSEALRTAAVVVCQKILEIRYEYSDSATMMGAGIQLPHSCYSLCKFI